MCNWLTTYQICIFGCAYTCLFHLGHIIYSVVLFVLQSSTTLWSRIARLLNILPTQQEIASASEHAYTHLLVSVTYQHKAQRDEHMIAFVWLHLLEVELCTARGHNIRKHRSYLSLSLCADVTGYGGLQSEQKQPLMEDVLLRGYAPLVASQELLDFGMDAATLTPIEEVCSYKYVLLSLSTTTTTTNCC